jgi:hypothetical protein
VIHIELRFVMDFCSSLPLVVILESGDRMLARGGPKLLYEDNLSDFPLCREVPFEQDCIEQLCMILYSSSWIMSSSSGVFSKGCD